MCSKSKRKEKRVKESTASMLSIRLKIFLKALSKVFVDSRSSAKPRAIFKLFLDMCSCHQLAKLPAALPCPLLTTLPKGFGGMQVGGDSVCERHREQMLGSTA